MRLARLNRLAKFRTPVFLKGLNRLRIEQLISLFIISTVFPVVGPFLFAEVCCDTFEKYNIRVILTSFTLALISQASFYTVLFLISGKL